MKYLISISLFFFYANLFSQDTITKRNREQLQTRIIKIGQDSIQYKKYTDLKGPIYSIAIEKVANIKYENGKRIIFNSFSFTEQTSTAPRPEHKKRGLIIGASFALGTGAYQNDIIGWFDLNMASNLSADLGYFFNNTIGAKTGVSYMTLPYGDHYENSLSIVGVPTMIMISIGNSFGFYSEIGTVFYFQSGNSNPIIAAENLLGFHITSDKIDFKLGFLLNFTIKGQPKELKAGTLFMGLNGGVSIHL